MHSIRQIQVLKALAQHRHFGRAATALGVSQPNLTRSLKHMEEVLGVALFDRQGVTPTVFGEIVLRHGERAIANFRDLVREVTLAKGLEFGSLRVSVGPYPADISGASATGELLQKHPNLFIEFRNANWSGAVDDVVDETVDLAFAETLVASANPDIEVEPVRSSRMVFFCAAGHPLAAKARLSVEDLFGFPWVGPGLPDRLEMSVSDKGDKPFAVFDEATGRLHPRALVGSFATAKEIVLRGRAVGAAIPFQIDDELSKGACIRLPIDPPWLTLKYGFIFKKGRTLSPAAVAFMETVRDIESSIPELT